MVCAFSLVAPFSRNAESVYSGSRTNGGTLELTPLCDLKSRRNRSGFDDSEWIAEHHRCQLVPLHNQVPLKTNAGPT